LIEDPGLRQALAQRSLARSAAFSWERCVNETVDAYRLALGLPAAGSDR
jgi:glycosyltransferase involved in cell wall biosynthesis